MTKPLPTRNERLCLNCKGENDRWPAGLCTPCKKEKDRKDSAYADTLAQHAYLSHLASRMMRHG